jgi:hypothetical protein
MAIVSSPENLQHLDRYKEISRRLALGEDLSDGDARRLAEQGKAIVWIDGGLHADEVLGAQQLIELVYQLATGSDPETLRVLRDVIVLAVHANPDGHALVADWYMRQTPPRDRSLADIPRAYQKYAGHDNNRDFYLASQAETVNMNRILYREWFPQIVYDHHQPAPDGTVMFAPPFAGPVNPVLDPLVPSTIDLIGGAMHARFAAEGKRGVTRADGSNYSMWWNGGLRTTAYFHNQIGLLTETLGSPTPLEIPYVPARQVATSDLPYPIAPRIWTFRQSIDYSMSANRAVLDAASKHRERLLVNAYQMARNSIEQGTRAAPRAYIVPADQPDFLTATKFIDALIKGGVAVHRATAPFTVNEKTYAAGSYVVRTAQAFRPHVVDMFEAQMYPHQSVTDGAAPKTPYDLAGWTLAFQMGVTFDRARDAFDGPFEKVVDVVTPPGTIDGGSGAAGYLVSHAQNDAFTAVNRLLKASADLYWIRDRAVGARTGSGSIYVTATPSATAIIRQAAAALGLSFVGVTRPPAGGALKLRPVRVGLWDRYGGASTSGWIRWILEQYEFPFERVYAPALDAGRLERRYDVLILSDEAIPARAAREQDVDAREFRDTIGAITWQRTVPQLKAFVENGGTLIAIGDSTIVAESLGVDVASALVEKAADGSVRPLPRDMFSIPGSLLRMSVDNSAPLGYGFEREVDVVFDSSPAFRIEAGAAGNARPVAWFAGATPLRSGWALGQQHLNGAAAVVEARVGQGRVLLFGPEITFRAQSHGTFKFLFNGIHYSRAEAVSFD